MAHPMPDQTPQQPPKRMTTAEVAALAQAVDARLDDLSAVVTDVATQVQDRATAHGELRDEIMGRLSGARPDDAPTRDQVDARIHEALQPLHDEVHELRQAGTLTPETTQSLHSVVTRLEDVERKLAAIDPGALVEKTARELHGPMADLRRRIANLEEQAKTLEADPVSHTLAEDALADQVQAAVERAMSDLSDSSEVSRDQVNQLGQELRDLRQHFALYGTGALPQTAAGVRAALQPTALQGTGAARKVLQLMRQVTHIGKEKEAVLGDRGGRFMFRGVDDAMDAVGHAMREVGLILGTTVLKDETTQNPVTKTGQDRGGRQYENTVIWTTTKLTVRYTFTDPEDGSTHAVEMVGEGRDASDHSTSKAASMALKYGLFQALMIPVTGLDDGDAAPPQRIEHGGEQASDTRKSAEPPARTDREKAERAGEALKAIRNVHRVEGGSQVQYNRLVQIMNQVKQEGLLEVVVDGATLSQHGKAAANTMQAYQPSQEELDRAVRDLPSANYPPEDDYR